jgi:hypothetical protein
MSALRSLPAVCGLALALGACRNVAPDEYPAVIVNPDDASRAALQAAVDKELRTHVLLADDALTTTSLLIIERNPPRSMDNPEPQGRITDLPTRFRLVGNGEDCILVDERDGSRQLLADTDCSAE